MASERTQTLRGALEAVDRVLNRGGDADDVLREVVAILHERAGFPWAGIAFAEEGDLVLGPWSGERAVGREPVSLPVSFQGTRVAELKVEAGELDEEGRAFLERVALVISPYCLVGWDTGGVPWSDVS